ncbi:MAG: ribosome hibernation-promoting factor, HPF/YfiA family [Terriglobales bacterium]
MNVEYTGRQYELTPAVRKQVEHGLSKLEKILGGNFEAHVILATEKRRAIAEITIKLRDHPMVGIAEAADMSAAVGEALDRIARQAVKYKGRWRAIKRKPRKKWDGSARSPKSRQVAVGPTLSAAVPVVVHSFPSTVHTTEAHIVHAQDAVALRPMTLEEAIKETEFHDREVFVFRDLGGKVKVLHRTRDGKLELIEAP